MANSFGVHFFCRTLYIEPKCVVISLERGWEKLGLGEKY